MRAELRTSPGGYEASAPEQAYEGTSAGRHEGGQIRGRAGTGAGQLRARARQVGGRAGANEVRAMSGGEWARVQTQVRTGGQAMSSLPSTLLDMFLNIYYIFFYYI